jgi:hypothetical protein
LVSVGAAKCLQHHFKKKLFMFSASLQCTLAVWYTVCNTMTNGGTGTVPPLVIELQTGSTNNHISQIFFLLAAPL